jgi:transposase
MRKSSHKAEAATELGVSVRHVKRMLKGLKKRGDRAVMHGLRERPFPRRLPEAKKQEAIRILSERVYAGFGPTLAPEYLGQQHGLQVSKETLRHWMIEAKLWRAESVRPSKCTRSGLGVRGAANSYSGTPWITIGWKDVVSGSI